MMTHTNKLFFLAEDNWEIMFGHYIFFLEHLQRCIFYSIAVIFSKWYRISFATDDNRILGLQAKSVLPIWLFTKYQYNHFTLEILLLICTSLIGPMTYFYQHLRPGTFACMYTCLIVHCLFQISFVSRYTRQAPCLPMAINHSYIVHHNMSCKGFVLACKRKVGRLGSASYMLCFYGSIFVIIV